MSRSWIKRTICGLSKWTGRRRVSVNLISKFSISYDFDKWFRVWISGYQKTSRIRLSFKIDENLINGQPYKSLLFVPSWLQSQYSLPCWVQPPLFRQFKILSLSRRLSSWLPMSYVSLQNEIKSSRIKKSWFPDLN